MTKYKNAKNDILTFYEQSRIWSKTLPLMAAAAAVPWTLLRPQVRQFPT